MAKLQTEQDWLSKMRFLNPNKQSRREMKRRIKAYLIEQSSPRLQAFLISLFVGASVFGAAALCLWLGLTSMPLRYGISVTWGYFMFYWALEWLVRYHLYRERLNEDLAEEVTDTLDAVWEMDLPSGTSGDAVDAAGLADAAEVADAAGTSDAGSFFDFSFDLDDGIVVVIPIILIAGALFIAFYFVWIAPAFIAEILLDAFLMGFLYRRLKKIESRSWLETVFQKTIWIFVAVLAVAVLAGFIMQSLAPGIVTMGDLFS